MAEQTGKNPSGPLNSKARADIEAALKRAGAESLDQSGAQVVRYEPGAVPPMTKIKFIGDIDALPLLLRAGTTTTYYRSTQLSEKDYAQLPPQISELIPFRSPVEIFVSRDHDPSSAALVAGIHLPQQYWSIAVNALPGEEDVDLYANFLGVNGVTGAFPPNYNPDTLAGRVNIGILASSLLSLAKKRFT